MKYPIVEESMLLSPCEQEFSENQDLGNLNLTDKRKAAKP
jgi:hypothetical protein